METSSYKKILVATDYTALSENAVKTAAAICRKQHATLILLHIIRDAPAYIPDEAHTLILDYTKEMKLAAQIELHRMGDRLRATFQIPVDEIILYGDVTKEIIKVTDKVHPDLVVIGTHGASGFRRFFIGSTAYRVIKHTRHPVLTIPGSGDWSTFHHILFPIRLIPDALKKYDHVRPVILADKPFFHILGLSMDNDPESVRVVFELEHELESRLKEDNVRFDMSFHRCHNYAEKILSAADEKGADLVVINATIDKSMGEFFIGPFSQQILNHAKVPVLCVRT